MRMDKHHFHSKDKNKERELNRQIRMKLTSDKYQNTA
jgi:hypothetical protein